MPMTKAQLTEIINAIKPYNFDKTELLLTPHIGQLSTYRHE